MSNPRSYCGAGPVGETWCGPHPRLRRDGGVACCPNFEECDLSTPSGGWRTIGSIITRVNDDVEAKVDRLSGLRRIGIDEISYKRGHRYLIVVVDHDTGRLVWAGPGRSEAALDVFFDELGEERSAELTHVSADMADWIAKTVARRRAPNAIRCADPFHVVAWAIEALDVERRSSLEPGQRPQNPGITWPAETNHWRLPDRSLDPVTHSGRTPTISTHANANNSTG